MSNQVYLELLAEDKRSVAYRPRFASLTGSALSAILLQQIIYWWKSKGSEPFFKFRAPSKHAQYQEGDSWCEELEWNTHEFDTALKVIATKVTKGVSKTDLLNTEMPIRNDDESNQSFYDRLQVAVSRCVIYWTDSSRVTWYMVNEELLGKFVSRIYLDKCHSLKYLKSAILADTYKNRKAADTSNTETTTEITKEEEAPAPEIPTPKPDNVIPFTPSTNPMADSMTPEYVAYLDTWRDAHEGVKPPALRRKDRTDAIDDAKELIEMGCTLEDLAAYIKERQAKGKSTVWRFMFAEIHTYLNKKHGAKKVADEIDFSNPDNIPKDPVTGEPLFLTKNGWVRKADLLA